MQHHCSCILLSFIIMIIYQNTSSSFTSADCDHLCVIACFKTNYKIGHARVITKLFETFITCDLKITRVKNIFDQWTQKQDNVIYSFLFMKSMKKKSNISDHKSNTEYSYTVGETPWQKVINSVTSGWAPTYWTLMGTYICILWT